MLNSQVNEELEYHRIQQIPLFCRDLLRCLGEQLAARADPETLRALFRDIGSRMAEAYSLSPSATTVEALTEQINDYLVPRHWGWISMEETTSYLKIIHHASPLREMLGDSNLIWSCGLMEGLLEKWLRAAGAGDVLKLEYYGEDAETGSMEFRLS